MSCSPRASSATNRDPALISATTCAQGDKWWVGKSAGRAPSVTEEAQPQLIDPVEQIETGTALIHADVASDLLSRLHGNGPAFFDYADAVHTRVVLIDGKPCASGSPRQKLNGEARLTVGPALYNCSCEREPRRADPSDRGPARRAGSRHAHRSSPSRSQEAERHLAPEVRRHDQGRPEERVLA